MQDSDGPSFGTGSEPPGGFSGDLIASSHDAIMAADARGAIVLWNDAAARLFGHPAEAAIGRSIDIIVPETMRGEHSSGMRRLAGGAAPRLVGQPVEVTALHADGSLIPVEMRVSMWRNEDALYFGAVIRDISERRRNEERLHGLAHYDQLTMLPNRTLFFDRMQALLKTPAQAAVLIADIDRFAELNDRLGYEAGDALLREGAVAMKRTADELRLAGATAARIGPNQFGLLLPGCADAFAALDAAQAIRDAFATIGRETETSVSVSVGVALFPDHGRTPAKLLANADFALRRAKDEGGDRRELFQASQRAAHRQRRALERDLRIAWEKNEFEVYFQPQVRLSDRQVVGAEALLRWNHAERGLTLPGAFIGALENTRLAEQVGDFVLFEACRQAAQWRDLLGRPFRMGVNLFERQLLRPDHRRRVEEALETSGLAPGDLEIELVETVMTNADDASVRRVKRLRDLGVGIAFDDYGTGYASLALLKRYPITRLKIDRGFVRDMCRGGEDAAIVDLLLTLGRTFGLGVIAEGVETHAQEALLRELGCVEAQGFLFGRPVPADVFQRSWLDAQPARAAAVA